MDQHDRLLYGYGAARVAVGLAVLVAPGAATGPWLGRSATDPAIRSMVRLVGVRDALLGGGTAWAASAGHGAVGWALAGAAADCADLLVTVADRSRLPRSARAVAALAAGGTATGLYIAWQAAQTRTSRAAFERLRPSGGEETAG
jgi:hypothetical protein